MRYLIDTNVLINIIEYDYISDDVQNILSDYENQIHISSESIKEFIHLVQSGKISPPKNRVQITDNLFDFIEDELNIAIKYISKEHLRTLAKLPLIDEHRDPTDRLIIAQAITEKLPLISNDTKFPKYRKYGLIFISNR
ncbi:MAG: type II toxin-antitoxin system VapC family toxin [Prevotellaceae bacterium]|jgi:PIN domain nuclease of toxin-antitoxin system|nr:type II toxin-antitoxin system VapC family toxin [Prevotellaceae bacterium]